MSKAFHTINSLIPNNTLNKLILLIVRKLCTLIQIIFNFILLFTWCKREKRLTLSAIIHPIKYASIVQNKNSKRSKFWIIMLSKLYSFSTLWGICKTSYICVYEWWLDIFFSLTSRYIKCYSMHFYIMYPSYIKASFDSLSLFIIPLVPCLPISPFVSLKKK